MEQEDLQIRREQARADGYRLRLERSEVEQIWWDNQRQDYFADWSESEKEKFRNEQSAMWDLIPPEFRQKAERLARGLYN